MNKQGIEKTTIKSAIALLVFSLVLEISAKNFTDYLIFVGIWFGMTVAYEFYKYTSRHMLMDEGIQIKTIFKTSLIYYFNIRDVFIIEGFLQRRFGLSSVYIVTPKGAIAFRDVRDGRTLLNEIEDKIGRERTRLNPSEEDVKR